eukprot:jgi/Undpi1/9978/HiC_scaffold_28.g12432.m1
MAELRSGLRQRVPQSSPEDNHGEHASVLRKSSKRDAGTVGTSPGTGQGAGAAVAAPLLTPATNASSLIHLGKLRIPESRRIDLTSDRGLSAGLDAPTPPQTSRQEEIDTGLGAEERGPLIELHDNRTAVLVPPKFVGGPSVIPFGMTEGTLQSGVVQIPLRYTVGETVDFIRSVSTVDRDYSRTVPLTAVPGAVAQGDAMAAAAGFYHSHEAKVGWGGGAGWGGRGGAGGAGRGSPRAGERGARGRGRAGMGGEEGGRGAGEREEGSSLSSRIYVTEDGFLKGFITMATLLTHQPETPVAGLLRDLEEMLREGDSWEDAAHRLRQSNVLAAPVVDGSGVLVAVLNPSDLLQEMEIEATDDIMRQSGSGGGESYFGTPLPRLVASRSFSSLILQSFQAVIEKNIVIALFLTMLTGTAGNAGNQSSAIVIRGLATGEIRKGNRMRVVWREARAAVASALVLSVASFCRVLLTPGATTVATLAVSTAMGATVIGAVMFGTIAPIVLDGMGIDPVNFASPALATLTDVSGVFILCSVAKLMLGNGA